MWTKIKDMLNKEKMYDIILALIVSVSMVCMTRVQFNGDVWGTIETNYLNKFGISAVVLGGILFFAILFLIRFVDIRVKELFNKLAFLNQEKQNKKKIILLWAVIILFAWLPYYLSYYPGGVYSDTYKSVLYVRGGVLSNRHPIFYTMLIGLFMKIGDILGKSLTWSIGFFTAIQMLVLQCEFLYFISWMLRHKINRHVRIFCSLFFAFFPLIPLYAISVWKDTPFCMAVLFWMLFIVDLYLEIRNGNFHIKTIVGTGIGMCLVAFTRNNGIYVVVFSILMLIIVLNKKVWQKNVFKIVGGVFC